MSITKETRSIALLLMIANTNLLISCGNSKSAKQTPREDTTVCVKESMVEEIQEEDSLESGGPLNEIRFKGWTDKDWIDNEYIRAVRGYIDDYNRGIVKDKVLDSYKGIGKGKFVVLDQQPFLLGGLYIKIAFIDRPEKAFNIWVYSVVDEKKKEVESYEVQRGFSEDDEDYGLTKEYILKLLKEHPEQKAW